MESDGVDLTVGGRLGKDSHNGIIRRICFNNDGSVRIPMRQDGSSGKRGLQILKRFPALRGKVPWSILARKTSEGNDDAGVILDESTIEVGEPKEGLDVADFSGFRPVLDRFDFGRVHSKSVRRKNKTKVLNSLGVELAFVGASVKCLLSESS